MIERKRYLELCQKNAVFPNSVIVYYKGGKCYPISFLMWFDEKGRAQNSAILHSIYSRTHTQVKLSEVCEDEQENSNIGSN